MTFPVMTFPVIWKSPYWDLISQIEYWGKRGNWFYIVCWFILFRSAKFSRWEIWFFIIACFAMLVHWSFDPLVGWLVSRSFDALFSCGHSTKGFVRPSVLLSIGPLVRDHESKSVKTRISAPAHPSATGGHISDLVFNHHFPRLLDYLNENAVGVSF